MKAIEVRRGCKWAIVMAAALTIIAGADGEPNRGAAPDKNGTPAETERPATPVRPGAAAKERIRIREGLELNDRVGTFELSGDRARFVAADDGMALIGLENLSLERVIHAIRDNPQQGQSWKVSGVVTEFEGRNYLLITRAILAARPN